MLLTNNHHKDILSSPRTPLHTPIRRNSHTAKTNSRLSTPNATRTISLKPEQPSQMSPPIRMNRSSQLFLNNDLSTDVPEALGKLDRVKLQDFLKLMIVGDHKVPGDRSNEIIRSLNGTWFKNTQALDHSSFRFFSSLGVKRIKQQNRLKEPISQISQQQQSNLFKNEYSPPNRFPPKKCSWKLSTPIKIQACSPSSSNLDLTSDSPLKAMVQKSSRSESKSNRSAFKRSFSQFQKTKKNFIPVKTSEWTNQEGLIKGKRMILYKD